MIPIDHHRDGHGVVPIRGLAIWKPPRVSPLLAASPSQEQQRCCKDDKIRLSGRNRDVLFQKKFSGEFKPGMVMIHKARVIASLTKWT